MQSCSVGTVVVVDEITKPPGGRRVILSTMSAPTELGVSSLLLGPMATVVAKRGVDVAAVLDDLGLAAEDLADPSRFLPVGSDLRLLNESARRSGDPNFGLHVGEHMAFGAVGLFEYVVATSPTLGAALQNALTASRLLSDFAWLELRFDDDLVYLGRRYRSAQITTIPTRHTSELFMAATIVRLRTFMSPEWSPLEIRFRHSAPAQTDDHARLFRTTLKFGAPSDDMVFDRAVLERPLRTADRHLASLLDRYAFDSLASRPRSFLDCARRAIATQIRGQRPSLAAIAKLLHVSPRTFQRLLLAENTSYSDLLDATRKELALQYLDNPSVTIVEIALAVGYSSLSTFYLAFRRWTGLRPAEYRRERTAAQRAAT